MRGNAAFELKLFVPLEGEEREESRVGGGRLNLQKHNGNSKPASNIQLCASYWFYYKFHPEMYCLGHLSKLAECNGGGTEEESGE